MEILNRNPDLSLILANDNLDIPGYDLFRTDYPSKTKRGGVYIYYRNSLALKS